MKAPAQEVAPEEIRGVGVGDGACIIVRRYGSEHPLRLVLSHGNGLAIGGYRAFWSRLAHKAELVLFDFRNHGMNPRAPSTSGNNWPLFVDDMDTVLHAIAGCWQEKPTFGVFHSLSALTALIHASQRPHPWRGLVVFEPPVVPPEGVPEREEQFALHRDLSERTRKRNFIFDSPSHLATSFARSPMFQRMSAASRFELAESTLREIPQTGKFELACPPTFEADTFKIWQVAHHWLDLGRVTSPVRVVASVPETSDTPVLSRVSLLLARDLGFECAMVPQTGHLLQLDAPQQCCQIVEEFVSAHDTVLQLSPGPLFS